MRDLSQNTKTNSANSAKRPDNRQPPPLAHVWQANLDAVLAALLTDGVRRVTLELDGQADALGRVKLVVRPGPQQEGKP